MTNSCSFQVLVHCLQLQTGKMTVRRVYFNPASADWKSRHVHDNMAEAGLSSHVTRMHGNEASAPTSGPILEE